ncbi:hypothetical protein DMN77_07550 [Paenibacillus sp. 79R4]|uniref:hypothetical protein n=1 Tax=Paenibacillus sp. 79R4 TaxID=2212847 RepID=UPI0015B8F919|nr:hypothetical protein [Paenibacillus sp. 79R4]NWL87457.1 hypothetical protein [Paenibacillus sp. 79R4]
MEKYKPFDEKSSKQLTDILKELFGDSEPFPVLKSEYKPIPLKQKDDINYEIQWQTDNIENEGHKVIHVDQNRHGETIIIYRLVYQDDIDDRNIHLRIRIITPKGVKAPDSNAFLVIYPETLRMEIADIRIEGDRVSRGYGSITMNAILKLVDQMHIRFITGWISSVDWDHINRSEQFYSKFGFECDLNHETKYGTITWINQSLGATREELKNLMKPKKARSE